VLAVWGCWLWAQAIGIERALRRAGGMQAWKRGKLLGPEDVERGEMSGAWKRDNEVGWREGDK
jgi:hypothetical protein